MNVKTTAKPKKVTPSKRKWSDSICNWEKVTIYPSRSEFEDAKRLAAKYDVDVKGYIYACFVRGLRIELAEHEKAQEQAASLNDE